MPLRKQDLVDMFEENSLGFSDSFKKQILVPSGRGGVFAARDYIHANAVLAMLKKYNVEPSDVKSKDDLKNLLPRAVNFRLNAYTPCLAYRYDELKPKDQNKLFDNKDYVFTEKENGCRGWFIHADGKSYLFSRNYSDVDCSLPEYWANISQDVKFPEGTIFAADVEIKYEPDYDLVKEMTSFGVATESKLEAMSALLQTYPETACDIQKKYKEHTGKDLVYFRMIHPLYYKGKNFLKRRLKEGKEVYDEVIEFAQSCGLNLTPIKHCYGSKEKKENFLNTIIEAGGEGVVVHNLNSYYCTSENRDKDCFIKIKRSVGQTAAHEGMGDCIEGWISGFKLGSDDTANEGLVAAFEVSCYMRRRDGSMKKHVIAYTPNITLEMKKDCTVKDEEGNPVLSEEYYNRVVEVNGQAISRQSMRLTHPKFIRFRMDKSAEECIYSEEWLESQMDNYR